MLCASLDMGQAFRQCPVSVSFPPVLSLLSLILLQFLSSLHLPIVLTNTYLLRAYAAFFATTSSPSPLKRRSEWPVVMMKGIESRVAAF